MKDSGKKASVKKLYEIPIRAITANTNPRNPLSAELQKAGWDAWQGDKRLWLLGTSENGEDRAEFVRLVREHDPEIVALATTILTQGLLEPVEVREGGTGTYTLVFGCRRCLATIFNWCMLGKPKEPVIQAFMVKGNSAQLLHRAVIENIRKPQTAIEEARAMQLAVNGGETVADVATAFGYAESTIQGRLKLLELEPKVQRAIQAGKLSPTKAMAERNGHAAADERPRVRSRKLIEEAADEYIEGSAERRVLDWVLGKTEKIG